MAGCRYNKGKPKITSMLNRLDLYFIEDLYKVLENGSVKYGWDNWKEGLSVKDILDSIGRHLMQISAGMNVDPESGLSHSCHIAANCMFLHHHLRKDIGDDDRDLNLDSLEFLSKKV